MRNVEGLLDKIPSASLNDKTLILMHWLHSNRIIECLDSVDINLSTEQKREVVFKVAKAIIQYGSKPETITRSKRYILARRRSSNGTQRDLSTD